MQTVLAIGWFILIIGYGIVHTVAGYVGVDFHLGAAWAIATLLLAIIFRFTLPLTIGAFFGAMDAWNLHWAIAALFAAPGLAFLIPGLIVSTIHAIRR